MEPDRIEGNKPQATNCEAQRDETVVALRKLVTDLRREALARQEQSLARPGRYGTVSGQQEAWKPWPASLGRLVGWFKRVFKTEGREP